MTIRRPVAFLALALAASVALNARLLATRRAGPASPRPAESARSASAAPSAAPSCAEELERCRSQGWDLAKRLIEAQAKTFPTPPAGPAKDTKKAGAELDVGAKEQREALCTRGLWSLRANWRADRDRTVQDLRVSLANVEEQEKNAANEADNFAEAIGLGGDTRSAFARDYRKLRLARTQTLLNALRPEPPDLDAALTSVRGLFADEDSLAARYGGESGRITWRQRQLEGRTTLLALGAAMADHDLEESVGW